MTRNRSARLLAQASALFAALVLVVAVFGGAEWGIATFRTAYIRFLPDVERAYTYGTCYLDADRYGCSYSIKKAEYFFNEALKIDPHYLYLQHQLARTAFLKGDFATALARISLEIENNPTATSPYYVRGLIKGFMGDYESSAIDYETYLKSDPYNWAALNDYAWVLLKAERFAEAAEATEKGLEFFPDNPWLLNSNAIALFELGNVHAAYEQAKKAGASVELISEKDWLLAYPGNDPAIAAVGIASFKKAVADNIHSIEASTASGAVQ